MSQKWLLCMYVIILTLQMHVNKYRKGPIYCPISAKPGFTAFSLYAHACIRNLFAGRKKNHSGDFGVSKMILQRPIPVTIPVWLYVYP